MPFSTFIQGQTIAVEIGRGDAPSGTLALGGAGAPWWGGGRRIPVLLEDLPSIQDQQGLIFPNLHAGNRQINQQPPVVGRQWSEGDFSGPATADLLGALMFGAMGAVSSNMVPGQGSMLVNDPVAVDFKGLNVTASQPTLGGNILRFDVKGTISSALNGLISISGVDVYGNNATEVISVKDEGLYWSRTSFSSIGASAIVASGLNGASVTIYGVKQYEHIFDTANSAPTFTFERISTPTAGNTASRSHVHTAMMVTELTLNAPAAEADGLITLDATLMGNESVTCVATSLNATSQAKIWPAWILKVTTGEAGSRWDRPEEFSVTIAAGNRNVFSAGASKGPQNSLAGGLEITGNFKLIAEDETEFNAWRGASLQFTYARMYTEWKLSANQNIEFGASLPLYYETMEIDEDDDMFVLNADFRTAQSNNYGIGRFNLICGVPGRAYGNNVV